MLHARRDRRDQEGIEGGREELDGAGADQGEARGTTAICVEYERD